MLVWLTRPRSAPTKTLPISAPSRASSSCRLSRRLVAGAGARLPSQPGAPLGPCSLPGQGSPRGLLLTSSFRPSASRFSVKMRVLSCAACHSPTVFGRPQGPHCQGPELARAPVAFSHVRQCFLAPARSCCQLYSYWLLVSAQTVLPLWASAAPPPVQGWGLGVLFCSVGVGVLFCSVGFWVWGSGSGFFAGSGLRSLETRGGVGGYHWAGVFVPHAVLPRS